MSECACVRAVYVDELASWGLGKVRGCVRACACACVCAFVRVYMYVYVCMGVRVCGVRGRTCGCGCVPGTPPLPLIAHYMPSQAIREKEDAEQDVSTLGLWTR